MRAIALYARVSSERQAQQATIDSQVAALTERARADGHRVLPGDIYKDDGVSGSTLIRPALERLRDRIAEGLIDTVYVQSPDRLARRYAYQVLLMEEFAACGITVIFLQGGTGATAEDALLTQVQGMIAEYERAKIIERNRRGKLHKARQGLVNALACAPYGYRYVRKTETEPARYDILLPEAKVVRQIFDALVHQQQPLCEIARRLTAKQIPTRNGAPRWDRTTIWGMIRNTAYIGKAAYGKSEAVEPAALRPSRKRNPIYQQVKGSRRDKPLAQWITIPVPPLVSEEIFAAAQKQLERNRRLSSRNARGYRYLLQGLTVCARCGYAFYGKPVSKAAAKGKSSYIYYRCVGTDAYRFAGGRVCQNPQVRVDQLDGYVWESVKQILQDPVRVMHEWSHRAATDGIQAERRAQRDDARRVLVNYERTLQRLFDAYEAGALDVDELTKRSDRIKQRLRDAQHEVEDAESKLAETVILQSIIGRLQDFAERVKCQLDQLSWEDRRQLIRTLVIRVEIDEQGATVVYRLPSTGGPAEPGAAAQSATGNPSTSKSFPLRGRRSDRMLRRARRWIRVRYD